MQFEIQPLSWHKRRRPTQEPDISSFEVIGFEKIHNHRCQVVIQYESGVERHLIGRVLQHPQRQDWLINGINAQGDTIALKLIE